ncbi:MAG: glycerol-3-phosphate dehydrogenase, partial [Chitinophagia bacterium]|nr:glycerol-3-phosphate dehydrogenase [Chitinophagia bacterium]
SSILAERVSVTEGVHTAPTVMALARRLRVEMPICQTVELLIHGELSVDEAIDRLLNRPFKEEH